MKAILHDPSVLRLALLLAAIGMSAEISAADKVALQLSREACFASAGYYVALARGYYAEAGLDVELRPGGAGIDPVEEVVSGRADFGVGDSSLVVSRAAGRKVVVMAAIFQHSPQVLLARKGGEPDGVRNLAGRRIALGARSLEIEAYLRQAGLGEGSYVPVPGDPNLDDLVAGRVDAIAASSAFEGVKLWMRKVPFDTFSPRSEGLDFYGDCLFTSDHEARQHESQAEKFKTASLRGWAWAVDHPFETVDLLAKSYCSGQSKDFLLLESAQVMTLVRDEVVELGYMNPARWAHIAQVFSSLGLMADAKLPDGFLWNPVSDLSWALRVLGLAAIFLVVALIAIFVYGRLYGKLKSTLERVRMFETVVEQSPVSVVITDPNTIIEFVNPGFTEVTGFSSEEVVGQPTKILKSGLTGKETVADLWRHLSEKKAWAGEFVNRRKNGEYFAEEAHIAPVLDDRGRITHYVAVKLDVTERKRAEERIEHLAHTDALTELPNRIMLSERFGQTILAASRSGDSFAVFCLDLDGFKPINDTYGHAAGDEVLREVARRWVATVRKADMVARTGGDEFVVLAPGVGSQEEAASIAEKLMNALRDPIATEAATVTVASSVGWAIYPEGGKTPDLLLRNADAALYVDKERRRAER